MIVRCPDCLTKYEIATQKLPDEGMKVRCPRCKAIFPVGAFGGETGGGVTASPPRAPEVRPSVARPGDSPAASDQDPGGNGDRPVLTEAPPRRQVQDPVVARRMARAMLTEMLLARADEHARSRAAGTLLQVFGPDLASAHVLYAERVSPDLPGVDEIFREAVNDVLGGGEPIL